MNALSLNTEKFILASLLGMTTLMMGAAMVPDTCKVQEPLWNQPIQSSANFISNVSRACR
ncbi:MAG: hypothetical protein DCF12_09115 [Snowella sp.]|jgi:hypothetical protein|nr:MAG: hypothetical protein DCF12_09115 [Snowella sp.]